MLDNDGRILKIISELLRFNAIVCIKVRDEGGSRAISDMLVKFVVRNRRLKGEMGFRPSLVVLPWCGHF